MSVVGFGLPSKRTTVGGGKPVGTDPMIARQLQELQAWNPTLKTLDADQPTIRWS
jgi:hypothetical protein